MDSRAGAWHTFSQPLPFTGRVDEVGVIPPDAPSFLDCRGIDLSEELSGDLSAFSNASHPACRACHQEKERSSQFSDRRVVRGG
jgi:hypothetical protein